MPRRMPTFFARVLVPVLAALLFTACTEDGIPGGPAGLGGYGGEAASGTSGGGASGDRSNFKGGVPQVSDPSYVRTPPPLRLAAFNEESAGILSGALDTNYGHNTGWLDLSNISKGYVSVKCQAPAGARFFVIKDSSEITSENAYQYYIDTDGTPNHYSISLGDGLYYFVLFVQRDDTPTWTRMIEASAQVTLEDEFAPFLINNKEVSYGEDSKAVLFSHDLTRHCSTTLEVAQQIFYWIETNVTYDTPKAEQLLSNPGYQPDPDETFTTKTGICYDYASLAAAMFRANGIPCKLAKGYAVVDESTGATVRHAWNLIWLEETGWIAYTVPTQPGEWFRIDLTFMAGGGLGIEKHIGNGQNYTITEIS